jgi:hypothetical protein
MNVSDFLNAINSSATSKFKISKKPGIDINQLREIENKLAIKLPNDLVEFYTTSNGLEGDDYIFNIIPLDEIEKGIDDLGTYLVFSEYMIYSETCGLEIDQVDNNKYKFFNTSSYPIENEITKRRYVADSIENFIKLYCRKGTFGIFSDGDENDEEENNYEEVIYEGERIESNACEVLTTKKPWWKFW